MKNTEINTTKKKRMITIKNVTLPIFTGFYQGLFDLSENTYHEIEYQISDYKDTFNLELTHEDFILDIIGYQNKVGYVFMKEVSKLFNSNFNIEFKFIKIDSPKFYNYETDKIICNIKIDNKTLKKIYNMLLENIEEFKEFLENNYKSRDGFSSFYSHNVDTWLKSFSKTEKQCLMSSNEFDFNYSVYNQKSHYFNGILDFVCSILEIESEKDIIYNVSDNVYIGNFIKLSKNPKRRLQYAIKKQK